MDTRLVPLVKFLGGKSSMTLGGVMDIIHDVLEKKCIADLVDMAKQNTPDTMPEFLEDYFEQKYGMAKLARGKLKEFLASLVKLKSSHRRIKLFGYACGLLDNKLYTKEVTDFIIHLLVRIYGPDPSDTTGGPKVEVLVPGAELDREMIERLKGVSEQLDDVKANKYTGVTYIGERAMSRAIIGITGNVDDPATWVAPQLLRVATPSQIRTLLSSLNEIPRHRAPSLREMGVDLDDFLDLAVESLQGWIATMQGRMMDIFGAKGDGTYLTLNEFKAVVESQFNITNMSEKALKQQWKNMIQLAGQVGSDGKHDSGVIVGADRFCVAATQISLHLPPDGMGSRAACFCGRRFPFGASDCAQCGKPRPEAKESSDESSTASGTKTKWSILVRAVGK